MTISREEGELFNIQGNEGNEGNDARQQLKKDNDVKVKKILHETTRTHELLTNSFYKAHLRKKGKALFLDSCSKSHVE
jgi:hypothetical protein